MREEDKKLLLEMKHNCLRDNGTTNETYNDSKRMLKAKAIDNVLQEIERLNNIIGEAIDRAIHIQKTFGYVLDDLIYLLMQGSDKE